jgi:brefeldin A-inhibited guanine nucleotide-exchange protein
MSDKLSLQEYTKILVDRAKKYLNKKHPQYNELYEEIINFKDIFDKFEISEKEKIDILKFNKKYKFWQFLYNLLAHPELNYKLSQYCLEILQSFLTLNITDLQSPSSTNIYSDKEKEIMKDLNKSYSDKIIIVYERKEIDNFIDIICKQYDSKEEYVWYEILKVFNILFFTKYYSIHQKSIIKIYLTSLEIYNNSEKKSTKEEAKKIIGEITENLFSSSKVNSDLQILIKDYDINCELINDESNEQIVAISNNPVNLLIKRMLIQLEDDVITYVAKLEESEIKLENLNSKIKSEIKSINEEDDELMKYQQDTNLDKEFDDSIANNNEEYFIRKNKKSETHSQKFNLNLIKNNSNLANPNSILSSNYFEEKNDYYFTERVNVNKKLKIDDDSLLLEQNNIKLINDVNLNIAIRQVPIDLVNVKGIKDINKIYKTESRPSELNINKIKSIIPPKFEIDMPSKLFEDKKKDKILSLESILTTIHNNDVYKKTVSIKNEINEENGIFGWCCVCRKSANYFCKITLSPICSIRCKSILLEDEKKAEEYRKIEFKNSTDNFIHLSSSQLQLLFNHLDAVLLIVKLIKLYNNSNYNLKIQILEQLLLILNLMGKEFNSNRLIIETIKSELFDSLIKNSLVDDNLLLKLNVNLFFKIWQHFREYLKSQISIFIEKVLIKILESDNSDYLSKLTIIKEFYDISGVAGFYVEIYYNYDCDLNEKNLLNSIIENICKIGQGKYSKSDYIDEDQEKELRIKSIETITLIITSLFLLTQSKITSFNGKLISSFVDSSSKNTEDLEKLSNLEETDDSKSKNQSNLNNQINNKSFKHSNTINLSNHNLMFSNKLKEKNNLELNIKKKEDLKKAVEKFNLKQKLGIQYLKKVGILNDDDPIQIANFLKLDGLKRDLIGEYLGEKHDLNLKVLEIYTDSFDFKNIGIIDSIRLYLSSFTLPGEGQKIDRIMQYFGNKYYKDNKHLYPKADVAYYLAYSIIIIQTDIHNPNVTEKRGLKGFILMVRSLCDENDVSNDYLIKLYNEIEKNPITMIEIEEMKERRIGSKPEVFKKEAKRLYEEGSAQIKILSKKTCKEYFKEVSLEDIERMVNSIWSHLLAIYSLNLEDCIDYEINSQCIEGMSFCIKLCGLLKLYMQRDAFIKYLTKLTFLLQGKIIEDKHILCLKTVLNLARNEVQILQGCWRVILSTISSVEFYHSAINGSKQDNERFISEFKKRKMNEKEIKIEKQNLEKLSEISPDDYDFIFLESINLSEDSFIEFIKSICEISKEEITFSNPRIFSLQKLIEVCDINISRTQIQWNKLWKLISEYLIELSESQSNIISERAIDSLRQLSRKFLIKNELGSYHFQIQFLQPFLIIYTKNINNYKIKEYVLTCVNLIVLRDCKTIKSGWTIIIEIYSLSAEDESKDIVRKAFEALEKLISKDFILIKENFLEVANCLVKFSNSHPEKVLELFFNSHHFMTDINHIHNLFECISYIIFDDREDIRKQAIVTLFNLINKLESKFTEDYWDTFFEEIILKLLQAFKLQGYFKSLETVTLEVVDIFYKYYDNISHLLASFIKEIVSISIFPDDSVSIIGLETINYIVNRLSVVSDENFFSIICIAVSDIFKNTNPISFLMFNLNKINDEEYIKEYSSIISNNIVFCMTQFHLIHLCEQILLNRFFDKLQSKECLVILNSLKNSFTVAHKFNCDINLRKGISLAYMSYLSQSAGLFKQQHDSSILYFKLLNKIQISENLDDEFKEDCRKMTILDSVVIIEWFIERIYFSSSKQDDMNENEKLLNSLLPVLIDYAIPNLIELKVDQEEFSFRKKLALSLTKIISCEVLNVRIKVQELLEKLISSFENSKQANCNNKEIEYSTYNSNCLIDNSVDKVELLPNSSSINLKDKFKQINNKKITNIKDRLSLNILSQRNSANQDDKEGYTFNKLNTTKNSTSMYDIFKSECNKENQKIFNFSENQDNNEDNITKDIDATVKRNDFHKTVFVKNPIAGKYEIKDDIDDDDEY